MSIDSELGEVFELSKRCLKTSSQVHDLNDYMNYEWMENALLVEKAALRSAATLAWADKTRLMSLKHVCI
jgi:hypothetical protein